MYIPVLIWYVKSLRMNLLFSIYLCSFIRLTTDGVGPTLSTQGRTRGHSSRSSERWRRRGDRRVLHCTGLRVQVTGPLVTPTVSTPITRTPSVGTVLPGPNRSTWTLWREEWWFVSSIRHRSLCTGVGTSLSVDVVPAPETTLNLLRRVVS